MRRREGEERGSVVSLLRSDKGRKEGRERGRTPADAGFWPVMRWPSTTTLGCQASVRSNTPPCLRSSVSSRNGIVAAPPACSSSSSVKPVNVLPLMKASPDGSLTLTKTAGAWQTAVVGLPAAQKALISLNESSSNARSTTGPWLHGGGGAGCGR